jgi:hypothetical protein
MTRKREVGKGIKHMPGGKKTVHGVRKLQRKPEDLRLRNYLMEIHPEFGLYLIGIS